MKTVTFEGVNFNASHLAKFSKAEFVKEFESTKVFKNYDQKQRKKLLEEAWATCKKAVGESVPESPAE